VAISYATWPDAERAVVHIFDRQDAPLPPGAVRASIPHVPAYLVAYGDGRRELVDIFAERSARTELLSAVSTAFARLAGWDYRAVWGETFRGAPALPNLEFLRGYAGCPIPERLAPAIDLELAAASGRITVGELGS